MERREKSIAVFAVYAIVHLYILYYMVRLFGLRDIYDNALYVTNDLTVFIRCGVFLFAAVMFTSYFSPETKWVRYIIGIIADGLFFLAVGCCVLALAGKLYPELILRMTGYILVYVVIPLLIAHFYGKICAAIKNNVISVILVLVGGYAFGCNGMRDICILPDFAQNKMAATMAVRFGELFNRVAQDTTLVYSYNPYTPFYISVTAVLINIFWLIIVLCIRGMQLRKKAAFTLIPAGVIIFALSLLPRNDSFIIVSENTSDSALNDSWNYERNYYQNQDMTKPVYTEDFAVNSYDIELWCKDKLKGRVSIGLSGSYKDKYVFTLHHDYKISSVCDENGNKLSYDVTGDYVTVYNEGVNPGKIIFEYKGFGLIYRGGFDYTYFPEYYKYYPVPGVQEVYDMEEANYVKSSLDYEADFHVKVHAGYKLYSNLNDTGYNEFEGKCTGVTLLGGKLVAETYSDGARIVYPILLYSEDEVKQAYNNLLTEYYGNDVKIEGKNWIVSNYEASTYENHYNGRDYFTGSYDEVKWIMSGKYMK